MLNLTESLIGGDISADLSKKNQNQLNLLLNAGIYPEQVYQMLWEEIVEKRRKIEELQEKCRKLEEKNRTIESVFETFSTIIIGKHQLSVNQYVSYTCLYLKDNNLIDDFWHSVPENLRLAGKIDA